MLLGLGINHLLRALGQIFLAIEIQQVILLVDLALGGPLLLLVVALLLDDNALDLFDILVELRSRYNFYRGLGHTFEHLVVCGWAALPVETFFIRVRAFAGIYLPRPVKHVDHGVFDALAVIVG